VKEGGADKRKKNAAFRAIVTPAQAGAQLAQRGKL
jgi:hypothetical protein